MPTHDIDPQDFPVRELHYALPPERIAQYPLAERDASKLLVYRDGQISEDVFSQVGRHLPAGSLLVFNDTRVIPARLHFQTPTGATVEVFCLEPVADGVDPGQAVAQAQPALWRCMVGGAKKWKQPVLEKVVGGHRLRAEQRGRDGKLFLIAFDWEPAALSFGEVLQAFGEVPIPPYFDRDTEEIDRHRYQTVYAGREGSVAAPTAGLHFTDRVFADLDAMGVARAFVTLHVGAGTFLPIQGATLRDHEMHAEWIDVGSGLLRALVDRLGRGAEAAPVIAVGTTSLRTLESLYWMGVKVLGNPDADVSALEVQQWDPYQLPQHFPADAAIAALADWAARRKLSRVMARTRLLIVPAYRPRMAQALVTNFHQPGSTLLLLIGAFVGDDWQRIYQHAMDHGFRFLSYGDSSLLWRR